jgi:hypothetical protein
MCRDCKWWQIEPASSGGERDVGMCIEEVLRPYLLRIGGNGGCARFVEGTPARAEGSSTAPPTALPTR